jgi:signal transduction histidine kinase
MSALGQRLAGAGAWYLRRVEYFIPPAMRADREASNQAKMFLISHSMGPILGNAVPLAVLVFNPTPRLDAVILAVAITMFWVFPFLLRWGVKYEVLVLTSVVNLNFCILWSCYFYGGVSSPTLPWLLTIPILSLFYIGGEKRLQPHLLAISAGSFAIFLAVYNAFPPPPIDMPPTATHGLGIVSTTAALCYVATMAIYYARIFDAGVELEKEVRRRRAIMDQLREAVAAADRDGSAKAEFLTRMSHELRNPLNAVIGYSQILREETAEDGQTVMLEDVDRIHEAGQYLLRLVNMILDLAKLEAGRMQFDLKAHPMGELVEQAIAAKGRIIELNGNAVVLDLDPALPEIQVDRVRFAQVLEAIVENAAQHTQQGTLTIRSRERAFGDATGFSIAVIDTGAGIDPVVLPTLFETFTASRDASNGRYGGTGLNLTVTHHLCKAMGGTIEVESTLGQGSCFTIVLPLRPPAAAAAALALPAAKLRQAA